MNLKLNRLQHIGIPVTNLVQSENFYKKLGFKMVMNATFMQGAGQGLVSMMQHQEIIIELYQMPEPELSNIKTRVDGRIDHVAFDVDDILETFNILKKEGFSMIEDEPKFLNFWGKGCRYFNISGPDGERLEFCQIL